MGSMLILIKERQMQTNKKQYFPLGYLGHYNKKGYKKIADIIIEEIKHH